MINSTGGKFTKAALMSAKMTTPHVMTIDPSTYEYLNDTIAIAIALTQTALKFIPC